MSQETSRWAWIAHKLRSDSRTRKFSEVWDRALGFFGMYMKHTLTSSNFALLILVKVRIDDSGAWLLGLNLSQKCSLLWLYVKWDWQALYLRGWFVRPKNQIFISIWSFLGKFMNNRAFLLVTKSKVLEGLCINTDHFMWEINMNNSKSYMLPLYSRLV